MNDTVERVPDSDVEIVLPGKELGGRSPSMTIAERVRLMADKLATGAPEHVVKEMAMAAWNVTPQQARNYLKQARQFIKDQVAEPKEARIAEAYAFLTAVIRDCEEHRLVRLKFLQERNELMGDYAPKKLAVSADLDNAPSTIVVKYANEIANEEKKQLEDVK